MPRLACTAALLQRAARLLASPALPAQLRDAAPRMRGFASQPDEVAASTVQSLKSLLRKLYLKVHPDLFADSPQEQATNQRSFVLLREYLSLLESDAEPQGRAQAFDFVFWLRRSPDDSPDADAAEAEPGAGLRRVAIKLPPPGRRQPGQDNNRCAAALRRTDVGLAFTPPRHVAAWLRPPRWHLVACSVRAAWRAPSAAA